MVSPSAQWVYALLTQVPRPFFMGAKWSFFNATAHNNPHISPVPPSLAPDRCRANLI